MREWKEVGFLLLASLLLWFTSIYWRLQFLQEAFSLPSVGSSTTTSLGSFRLRDDKGSLPFTNPSLIQFSHSVMPDSLWLHRLQHTKLPCPTSAPGACSNSYPLSRGGHPTILSFVICFSSCLQSSPTSGSFPMSQFFTSGGQSIGASGSASVLPMNTQDLISFRIDWFDLLAVQGTLKSLLQHHSSKASIRRCSPFFMIQLSHPYMTTGKTKALTKLTFVGKVMSLLFNMLSRLVITFLPRSEHLLVSWLSHHLQWFWNPPK